MKVIAATALVLMLGLSSGLSGPGQDSIPEKPINLAVKPTVEGAMAIARLKWEDRSDNELGFEVLRSADGKDFSLVGSVGANTERHRDEVGRYTNGAFVYRVRAFNATGRSEESNAASVWF